MPQQIGAEPEEEERAVWRARAEAVKEAEEASAKAWEDAAGTRGRAAEDPAWPAWEENSSPPSPIPEHRSKSLHDPARRVEADARAAAEVASHGKMDEHEPVDDQTIVAKSPPAADPADAAGRGDDGGCEPETAPTGGGAPPPRAEAMPGGSNAMVVARTSAPGCSIKMRPAGSGTCAGSAARMEQNWASAGEATSGAGTGDLDTAVSALHLQFADNYSHLQSFAQAELDRVR